MTAEHDSLSPHLIALAKSQRARALAWRAATLFAAVAGYPAFQWLQTRYDRASAEALTARVAGMERVTGLPPIDPRTGMTIPDEHSLRDRVKALEEQIAGWDAAQREHDIEVYERLVSLAAATTERRPALRAAAARAAVTEFRAQIGRGIGPAQAASVALETAIPGH